MLQESGKTVTGHEYPGRRLVQRRQTRPPAAAVRTHSVKETKNNQRRRRRVGMDLNRSLCAPHRSQATGKRGLCCVRTMKRDTLNSASDQMKYPSHTISDFVFTHYDTFSQSQNHHNKRHILPITTYYFWPTILKWNENVTQILNQSYQLF